MGREVGNWEVGDRGTRGVEWRSGSSWGGWRQDWVLEMEGAGVEVQGQ